MAVNSRVLVLNLEDAADVVQALRCHLNSTTFSMDRALAEDETFCDVAKSAGNPSWSMDFSGFLDDDTTGGAYQTLFGLADVSEPKAFQYGPLGDASGKPLISGFGYLTGLTIGHTAGGNATIAGTLTVDGDVVETNWPA